MCSSNIQNFRKIKGTSIHSCPSFSQGRVDFYSSQKGPGLILLETFPEPGKRKQLLWSQVIKSQNIWADTLCVCTCMNTVWKMYEHSSPYDKVEKNTWNTMFIKEDEFQYSISITLKNWTFLSMDKFEINLYFILISFNLTFEVQIPNCNERKELLSECFWGKLLNRVIFGFIL